MIDRRIAKFKLRRGTDAQRQTVVFDEGELIYVTDSQRIYVGTGEPTLSGGVPVGSVVKYMTNKPPAIHSTGDIYYQENLGKLFIYNNENYSTFVGPYGDDTSIVYNNSSKLSIASGGIVPYHLNSSVVNVSGGVGTNSSGLYVNYDPTTLQIDGSNRLAVIPGMVTQLDPYGGIVSRPSGAAVNADNTTIKINIPDNTVSVKSISANNIAVSAVEITKLHTNVVQPSGGLQISVSGLATNHDNNTLKIINGKLAVDLSVVVAPPAGTIIYTACQSPPNGYLLCDGSRVSLLAYPGLSAIYVGDGYNNNSTYITFGKKYLTDIDTNPNASGTWISLPDLRGEFIRGWKGSRDVDTGRLFGTFQAGSLEPHTHTITDPGHTHTIYDNSGYLGDVDELIDIGGYGDPNAGGGFPGAGATGRKYTIPRNTTGITGTNSTGNTETRPRNIALLPCIKY
jgi:hypothetical protein